MKARRLRLLASFSAAAVTLACIDITVNKAALGSIEVVNHGAPSVVSGDTLRDTAGNVSPLEVRVYNAGGELIKGSSVQFVSTDTPTARVTVSSTGIVVGTAGVTGTAKVFAVVDSQLQSVVQLIEVVAKPESLAVAGVVRDTINYRTLATDPYDTSAALAVRVAGAAALNVPKWLVSFSIFRAIDDAPITDTTSYVLVTDDGRISSIDTTDVSGIASRRLRFHNIPGTTLTDSVYVLASARLANGQLTGSPKRFVVLVTPRTTTP